MHTHVKYEIFLFLNPLSFKLHFVHSHTAAYLPNNQKNTINDRGFLKIEVNYGLRLRMPHCSPDPEI